MREMLFRGKRVDTDEWVEGGLITGYDYLDEYPMDVIAPVDAVFYPHNEISVMFLVNPETVGQYTGLTDKNGVKIFEGDIVDASDGWWGASGPAGHDSPIIKVEYDESVCGFAPFAIYDCDCDVYIYPDECTVIGNIHDNPELIGGDNNDK